MHAGLMSPVLEAVVIYAHRQWTADRRIGHGFDRRAMCVRVRARRNWYRRGCEWEIMRENSAVSAIFVLFMQYGAFVLSVADPTMQYRMNVFLTFSILLR
jgi:hypothetical protein